MVQWLTHVGDQWEWAWAWWGLLWWTASWEWEGCFFRRVSGGLEGYFGKRSVEGRKVALVDGQLLENGRAALMDGEFRVRKLP